MRQETHISTKSKSKRDSLCAKREKEGELARKAWHIRKKENIGLYNVTKKDHKNFLIKLLKIT